ncbi:MFS transporter [Streptosporangium sp. NBC_01755]|uniref:MFS transporter n=1 Tax=unclassified Streptosporangium TaxID=2632669 RepID=UPI002DDAE95A|nr:MULTISPECIES: MFS transporter [unclassified Streptosporangium]WSA29390.1 MFS transporter [Streptosporangium sp. NBC_01810]WSC99166.1 MFS transporter [Streptosporangium sp. NBC_01755]
MADLLGRRRVFLIGVALFGMASLACGLAQQPWQLVAGRFTQGAGAAMASPAALSVITLLFPGTEERTRALGIWGAIAALLLAAVLAAGFLVVEPRTAEPLVPMSFLSDRTRAVANGATLLFSVAMYAMAFLLMIHLQTVLGYGPLQAGVAYLPYGAGILLGMRLSTRAMTRVGVRWTLVLSFLIGSAGLLLLSGVVAGDSYAAGVLPGMLVTSLGCGLGLSVLTVAALTVAAALLALGAVLIAALLRTRRSGSASDGYLSTSP